MFTRPCAFTNSMKDERYSGGGDILAELADALTARRCDVPRPLVVEMPDVDGLFGSYPLPSRTGSAVREISGGRPFFWSG